MLNTRWHAWTISRLGINNLTSLRKIFAMATGTTSPFEEREVRFAIWTEISQMVRQFFPETLVGFGDLYRQDDGTWTVSLYMPETGIRETYALGLMFSDPAHALTG